MQRVHSIKIDFAHGGIVDRSEWSRQFVVFAFLKIIRCSSLMIIKHLTHSPSVKSPIHQSGNLLRRWESTFGKSLPRAGAAGVLLSAVLAMLAGAAVFEPAEDAVEMGQAVETTRVADVGNGLLRLGELLFCLGDAAGLDETDEVGSGGLPEDVRKVGGGQARVLGGFRQGERWIAEFAFDKFPRAANLDPLELDLQVADALSALAKLTRKQFQQAHQPGDLVRGQIGSAFVGGAQLAFGNSEPREPFPETPERRGRSWLAQELAAGDGGDVAAEDEDGNGDVPETRVTDVSLRLAGCRHARMMPPVARGAAEKPDAVGANQSAHGIELILLELVPDDSGLRLIQRHDHAGELFQNGGELGELRRVRQVVEIDICGEGCSHAIHRWTKV